jgi:hypothetical protein
MASPLLETKLFPPRLRHRGGPAIARELFVSVNTLRTHTKNIYAKLGLNSRQAAVRQAEELGLLSRAGGRDSGTAAPAPVPGPLSLVPPVRSAGPRELRLRVLAAVRVNHHATHHTW